MNTAGKRANGSNTSTSLFFGPNIYIVLFLFCLFCYIVAFRPKTFFFISACHMTFYKNHGNIIRFATFECIVAGAASNRQHTNLFLSTLLIQHIQVTSNSKQNVMPPTTVKCVRCFRRKLIQPNNSIGKCVKNVFDLYHI